MCAKCVEELQVYQKALDAADAVSAILKRPCFQRDHKLRDQLADSTDAVAALNRGRLSAKHGQILRPVSLSFERREQRGTTSPNQNVLSSASVTTKSKKC
jgi:hypothetical protein